MLKSVMSGLVLAVAIAGSPVFATVPSNDAEHENKMVVHEEKRISPSELGTLLQNLGYEAKIVSKGKNPVYRIVEKRSNLTAPINVSLSPSGKILWFEVSLVPVSNKTDTVMLRNLLSMRSGKTKLIIQEKYLRLWFPIDNSNITPQVVRAELNSFVTDVGRAVKIVHSKSAAPSIAKK